MCGCYTKEVVYTMLPLPGSPPLPSTTLASSTVSTTLYLKPSTSTTLSLEEIKSRWWNIRETSSTTLPAATLAPVPSSTSTTYLLKRQGGRWEDFKRITTTTVTIPLPPIPEDWLECRYDSDCGLTYKCCPCEFGGAVYTMNRLYIPQWRKKIPCPVRLTCGFMKRPCKYTAYCVNGSCVKEQWYGGIKE